MAASDIGRVIVLGTACVVVPTSCVPLAAEVARVAVAGVDAGWVIMVGAFAIALVVWLVKIRGK